MPFGVLTAQTLTYEPRKPGVYSLSTVALGAPSNEFRFSGANRNKVSKLLSVAVTRIRQKDVVPVGGTIPIRREAIATVNIQLPSDGSFTAVEASSLLLDIQTVLTAAILTRLASSEI